MEYRQLGSSGIKVPVICLGTWAFGGDSWWGYQDDRESVRVLDGALAEGINFIPDDPN